MLDRRIGVDTPDDEVVVLLPPDLSSMTVEELDRYEVNRLLKRNFEGFDERDLASKLAKLAPVPPTNNMGGPYPHPPLNFPHSEKKTEIVVQKTMIDWFGFTSPHHEEGILLGLQILWPDMISSSSKAGMRGFPKCRALYVGDVQFGLLGYGAKHGRCSVSLTGVACKTITTVQQFEILRELMDVLEGRLTRVDLCFDFYKGEVTFDYALFALERGDFKSPKANKAPETRIVSTSGAFGENLGRTLYIGPRKGEKYGRVYEKGLEVFAKMPEEFRIASTEREMAINEAKGQDGGDVKVRTIADDWLRLEVEFKRVDSDRPIPLEIILDRDNFFAGAFPFYAWARGQGDGKGRSRLKSDAVVSHGKLMMSHRAAYGNHVHTLLSIGFTPVEVCNLLSTGKHNQKLLKAGLVAEGQQAVQMYRLENDPDWDIPLNF